MYIRRKSAVHHYYSFYKCVCVCVCMCVRQKKFKTAFNVVLLSNTLSCYWSINVFMGLKIENKNFSYFFVFLQGLSIFHEIGRITIYFSYNTKLWLAIYEKSACLSNIIKYVVGPYIRNFMTCIICALLTHIHTHACVVHTHTNNINDKIGH